MRLIPEDTLRFLMNRPGEIPPPGNDRWGKAVQLKPGAPSYTVINTGYLGDFPTAIALQLEFSLDDTVYTPFVPLAYGASIAVDLIKAVDAKAGAFREETLLASGQALPFCTLLARALTVSVEITNESAGPIFVHAVAAPVQTVDCESITIPQSVGSWNDVESLSVAANTVGEFVGLAASPAARQIIVQNNSDVDLLLGFGSFIPSNGPPPASNLILPGGFNGVWESKSFLGAVNAIFATGGSAAQFATFTRGISD